MSNELYNVMTFSEATQLWGLSESTLRQAVSTGSRFQEGIDYRKSGKVWLIRKASMERVYGRKEEK